MSRAGAALLLVLLGADVASQEDTRAPAVGAEYQVKAAFLYQFARFVEWPEQASPGPLTICIAGQDVFGGVLEEMIRGETVDGRPLDTRIILSPEQGCHILFIPDRPAAPIYLRAAQGTPTLTVGESARFIDEGGVIRLFVDGTNVRFEVNLDAADRSGLRLSSRLIQLARRVESSNRGPE